MTADVNLDSWSGSCNQMEGLFMYPSSFNYRMRLANNYRSLLVARSFHTRQLISCSQEEETADIENLKPTGFL